MLTEFHSYQDSVRWRLVPAGVEIEGSGVERTRGAPITVTRVWEKYAVEINRVAREWRVPCALIIATICTESGGRADAVRLEPGYISDEATPQKVSSGLMQTLLSTAREALQMSFDRAWLLQPANSIRAGTAYIARQAKLTGFDPPLVAAAYNAGQLAHQNGSQNRWKLRQYPIGTGAHCDRFVQFFNDAVFVLGRHSLAPAIGLESLLGTTAPTPRRTPVAPKADSRMLSGPDWVSQFPASRAIDDLEITFRGKVERFLGALRSAGATVTISSTCRPPQRAYLMHWAWRIAKEGYDPQKVPSLEGVTINWWHGDAARSRQAAQAMVNGYGINNLKVPPALTSRHIQGLAIDMDIAWQGQLKIKQADSSIRLITSTPTDGANGDLIEVGKTYGVIHFINVAKDRPHWSTDGK
jgi:hypothetical protein